MATYRRPSPEVRDYCEKRRFSSHVRDRGFDYLVERWSRTVAAVEAGYRLTLDEFRNDLDARRIIDELATHARDDEWADVEAALLPLDARFLTATRPVRVCVYGATEEQKSKYHPDRHWYYFRVPAALSHVPDRDRWP